MADSIKVSIFCLAYNHEKYLKRCLDGFIMQKTTFPFEVLVHDDASTDGTAEIIKEYAEKYPEIIKPTFQTENQYSKGVKIIRAFLLEQARGEYFAWCEGDDFWTDSNKLQKQISFLDSNPEYSSCYHKVVCNSLVDKAIREIPAISESRDFSVDEIIKKGAIFQLSSAVIRSKVYRELPDCFFAKGFGDVQLYIYSAMAGKCYVMSDPMSVYNHGVEGSYTMRNRQSSKEKRIKHEKEYMAMLQRVNEYYNYKYNDVFSYAIDRLQFNIYILSKNRIKALKKKYRGFYKDYIIQKTVLFVRDKLSFLIKIRNLIRKD